MSNKTICRNPQKGIDDKIAEILGIHERIATRMRADYDEAHPDSPLDVSDLNVAARVLINYTNGNKAKKESEEFAKKVANPVTDYVTLKEEFPDARERFNRIAMIANIFSSCVDALQATYPTVDREDIIKGFISGSGEYVGGPANIFKEVYKRLNKYMLEHAAAGDQEGVDKYKKIFANLGALNVYSTFIIRDTEGVNIGHNLSFAASIDPYSTEDSANLTNFVVEESTKEHWQELTDSISPFGSVSKLVRRVLSRLSENPEDESFVDDLGFPIRMNPVKGHQQLMEILRGVRNESEMVTKLLESAGNYPFIKDILNEFRKDPILRTQFFVDFSKAFQTYTMLSKKDKKFSFSTLNNLTRNKAFGRYLAALKTRTLDSSNAVFTYGPEGAENDEKALKRLSDIIEDFLGVPQKDTESKASEGGFFAAKLAEKQQKDKIYNKANALAFYKNVLPALGIHLNNSEYDILIKDRKRMRKINKAIIDLPTMLRRGKANEKFEELLNRSYGSTEGFLKEKLGTIFQVTEGLSTVKKVLSRIRYQGNNYFSDVKSSYLGRFSDTISTLANSRNADAIKNWLNAEYLRPNGKDNKVLFSDGIIRNRWLRDLYESSIYNEKSFANQFTYTKFLGDDNQEFNDFGAKKQAYTQLIAYFAESKNYAWYPVFILGDSGASKYIRAPRYSEEEILDGIFDLYMQEKEFQNELKEFVEGLKNSGYSAGSLGRLSDNKFGVLQFLQEPKYANMIDNRKLEESVKAAAREYFRDSFDSFKGNLSESKVLDRDEKGRYLYLNSNITRYRTTDNRNLEGEAAVNANLKDYFWNHQFAMMQQMNIMVVNPLFFSDGSSLDLQKRNKQIHASGDRLSVQAVNPFSSTREKFSDKPYQVVRYFQDIRTNTEETDPEFMEVLKSMYSEDSDIYKAYRDRTSLTDGQGYRTLESYRAVMGMAGKWNKKTELAYQKLQDIRREIRENGKVNAVQRKAIEDLMLVLQPLKPFTYTLEKVTIGDNTFTIPVQLKYAEIIVIPELCKEGKLKTVMEWAEQKTEGIPNADLVLATTGCKVGGFGEAHIEDATDAKSTIEELNKSFPHNLPYEDMIIQTNVPDHVHGSQLFATQSRKIVMSGLRETDDLGNTVYYNNYIGGNKEINLGGERGPVPPNAYNINRLYVGVIATNILESLDKFSNTISDIDKVRRVLTQMTINNSRESKDNLNGYELTPEGMFLVPLFEGGIEHDTAAFLLSLFKKQVNKQKILGGSAVQASAFGINGYTESDNLRFVYDYDENGKPTNILYAQCEMPFDLSYTDSKGETIKLKFEDWCNADGTLKMGEKDSLLEEQFPGITYMIAYRIPTEAKYSMLNLKVVRFTQKVDGGGTIKVPAQGTTIAGFDFDIDKLYFMKREFKFTENMSNKTLRQAEWDFLNEHKELKNELHRLKKIGSTGETNLISQLLSDIIGEDTDSKSLLDYKEGAREQFESWLANNLTRYNSFESYDYAKTPWDKSNTRIARNNLLINIIQHRLADPNSLKERITPGGFDNIKRAAKYMRTILGTDNLNYVYSDPWTMVLYNQQNQVADKLIGVFANQNANHNISLLLKDFYLENAIAFGNHSEGLNNLKTPNSLSKELLAAAVDAVKDPQLIFLNLNTVTAASAGLLCRLGYSFEEIGLLFNQPIIKHFCDYCAEHNFTDFDTAIENIKAIWKIDKTDIKESSRTLSNSVLESQITSYRDNKDIRNDNDFKYTQARVLQLFAEIYKDAQEVSSFITNTKFTAANAVKSTFGGMIEQQEKVRKYVETLEENRTKVSNVRLHIKVGDFLDNPIDDMLDINDPEYFIKVMNNPFGYEQAMYDANVAALKALYKYYPYGNPDYSRVRAFISKLSPIGLDEETINKVHDYIMRYAVSNVEYDNKFNPNYIVANIGGENINAETYYSQYVPIKIAKLLRDNPRLKSYPIFDNMVLDTDNNGIMYIKLGDNGALEATQKEAIRESWESLLNESEELRTIAEDLYMYSYYQSGFGFGVVGFNHLASVAIKQSIMVGDTPYLDFIRDFLEGNSAALSSIDHAAFARYFIENNRDNRRLVYTPKDIQLSAIRTKSQPRGISLDNFEVEDSDGGFEFLRYKKTKKASYYRPAVMIDGVLYICNNPKSRDGAFNASIGNKMTYTRAKDISKHKVVFKEASEDSSNAGVELISLYDSKSNLIGEANINDLEALTDIFTEVEVATVGITEKVTPEARNIIRNNQRELLREALKELKGDFKKNVVDFLIKESEKVKLTCKVTNKEIC